MWTKPFVFLHSLTVHQQFVVFCTLTTGTPNWTYEELATYVYQTTGIAVKRTAMRDFGQRHDIRPYRPTYRSLRGDPAEQRVAQAALAAVKKSPGQRVCAAESR